MAATKNTSEEDKVALKKKGEENLASSHTKLKAREYSYLIIPYSDVCPSRILLTLFTPQKNNNKLLKDKDSDLRRSESKRIRSDCGLQKETNNLEESLA